MSSQEDSLQQELKFEEVQAWELLVVPATDTAPSKYNGAMQTLAGCQTCIQPLPHSLSSARQGEHYTEKFMGQVKETTHNYCHRTNRLHSSIFLSPLREADARGMGVEVNP